MEVPTACAVIPARGGSKGLLRKNLRYLGGLPLVAHSIRAARATRSIDRVIISTEDEEIASVSLQFGAEVIRRPSELATDEASSEDAVLHVLDVLDKQGYHPDLTVFLQCTSPLTAAEDIEGTVRALVEKHADTALAVTPFHHFLWGAGSDGDMVGINHDKRFRQRRQERQQEFLETGAVYVMRTVPFRSVRHRFFGRTTAYVMPPERTIEIDAATDLHLANLLLNAQNTPPLPKNRDEP